MTTTRPTTSDLITRGALAVLLLAGCGNQGAQPGTDGAVMTDAGTPGDGGAGSTALVGYFRVSLVAPVQPTMNDPVGTPGYTTAVGKVSDGPTPELLVWEKAAEDGPCQLLTPRVPFCSTPCTGGAVCVENDTCRSYPTAKDVGAVKIAGVRTGGGGSEVTLELVAKSYQIAGGESLPYPAFDEGAKLRLTSGGGAYPVFSIDALGIAPLLLDGTTVRLESGKATTLTWTPPGKAGISRIQVKLDVSHHGGTKGKIVCDAPDTGRLELTAALVKRLLDLGIAGFPTIQVSRVAVGSTTIPVGRVDLSVVSELERDIEIPGLVSCTDSATCPKGTTCQNDLTCR